MVRAAWRAATVEAAGVAEDDDPDPFSRSKGNRRMEAGQDAGLANSLLTPSSPSSNAKPMPGTRGSGWKCGWNMVATVSGFSTEPCSLVAFSAGRRHSERCLRWWSTSAPAHGRDFAVGDLLETAGAQHVSGGQVADPFRSDEVGVLHAQGSKMRSRR